jgi:hypothetical protein
MPLVPDGLKDNKILIGTRIKYYKTKNICNPKIK